MSIRATFPSHGSEPVSKSGVYGSEGLSNLLSIQRETEGRLASLEVELEGLKRSWMHQAVAVPVPPGREVDPKDRPPVRRDDVTFTDMSRRCRIARAATGANAMQIARWVATKAPRSTIEILDQLVRKIEYEKAQLLEVEQEICMHRPKDLAEVGELLEYISSSLLLGDADLDLFAWLISDCAEKISEEELARADCPQVT